MKPCLSILACLAASAAAVPVELPQQATEISLIAFPHFDFNGTTTQLSVQNGADDCLNFKATDLTFKSYEIETDPSRVRCRLYMKKDCVGSGRDSRAEDGGFIKERRKDNTTAQSINCYYWGGDVDNHGPLLIATA